jgi:predicted nucleic acid-binding protein
MKIEKLRLYLDVCCLNRPFDDLSQEKVYLEAEAVLSIVSHCEREEWILLSSSAIDYELSQMQDDDKFEKITTLYIASKEWLALSIDAENRAKYFQRYGIKALDSFHMALAETQKADVFLTTDARLLQAARKLDLAIKISNPLSWLMEVMWDE